ncbi:MAG: HTTM domain-containing protein [Flavitalea sp.]
MTETKTNSGWFGIFRTLFGILVMFGAFRFFYNGWIDSLYLQPTFHFTFRFFEWVKVLPPVVMYFLFGLMIVCGLAIAINKYYRAACIVFFLVFTYVELIDVTYYLNHYYLVSLLGFIMIFYDPKSSSSNLYNQRIIFFLKLQVSIVYFFGGINKIESDWLIQAQPLKIWLFAHNDMAVLGKLLANATVAHAAAWLSMIFDVSVAFLLWFPKTRFAAYIALSVFHILTALLFNIGIFPWIMMITTLLFFGYSKPIKNILNISMQSTGKFALFILSCVATWQLVFPLRHLLYPGNYLWTEQGFRFSWNIMLMEKNGSIEFGVQYNDNTTAGINEKEMLTPFQLKMVSTQPDLILQFANLIKQQSEKRGSPVKAVYAACNVSLNGRRSALYFDPKLNLLTTENELLQNIRSYSIPR